jgi:hypothetical protein
MRFIVAWPRGLKSLFSKAVICSRSPGETLGRSPTLVGAVVQAASDTQTGRSRARLIVLIFVSPFTA